MEGSRPQQPDGSRNAPTIPGTRIPDDHPAVVAARRGWPVFPCEPGGKRPVVSRWQERACADVETVIRCWPGSQYNVGIPCELAGVVVLDADTHGQLADDWRLPGVRDGRDVLACLCEWAGQPWPSTYWVATPSGGWHLYFTAPAGVVLRNTAGKLGPMVDTRGAGGYVLAAGSVVDGKPYEVLDDRDPAPLPGWLCWMLAPPPAAPRRAVQHHQGSRSGDRLRGLVATVAEGQPGDRNGRLFWAACRTGELIAAGEVDAETATEALVDAALQAGLRGGERAARRTVAS